MLYPIIRRVRRPLLPPEALPTATPPAVPEVQPQVEERPVIQSPAEPVAPQAPQVPEPDVSTAVLPEQKPTVTPAKAKRAKAAEEKSRKTVEPGA